MKKSNQLARFFAIFTALFLLVSICFSQSIALRKANNTEAWYYTNKGFSWNGPVKNGFCHGYGTIQWYDVNGTTLGKYTGYIAYGKNEGYGSHYNSLGYLTYSGYWKNDMKNGFGTEYDGWGSIIYQGPFVNDQLSAPIDLSAASGKLASMIVSDVFFGGKNVEYQTVKAIFSSDNKLEELRVRITFNGDINTSNEYDCTVVVNLLTDKVSYVNCNTTARKFLNTMDDLRMAFNVLKVAHELDKLFGNL